MGSIRNVLSIVVFLSALCLSAQEMVTDRPDQTESANIVEKGHVQVELGTLFERDEFDSNLNSVATLFRLGLTSKLELRFGLDQQWLYPTIGEENYTGLAPVALGFKLALSEEDCWRPKLALLTTFSIPFSDYTLQSAYSGIDMRLLGEHTFSEKSGLGWNLGVAWNGDDAFATGWYSIAYGRELLPFLGFFAEIFGEFGPAPDMFSCDAGFTIPLKENLQLDLYGGTGLNDAASDYFIGLGLSFRLPH